MPVGSGGADVPGIGCSAVGLLCAESCQRSNPGSLVVAHGSKEGEGRLRHREGWRRRADVGDDGGAGDGRGAQLGPIK